MNEENQKAPPGHEENLWLIALSPAIWAAHFLLCYITATIWCAKVVGRDGSLEGVRIAVAIYTVVALFGIIATGLRGFRMHVLGAATVPHDFDTPEDRHRFLGFATVLLSGLSAVATIYVAASAVFIGDCY